jgi:hypothetical protein
MESFDGLSIAMLTLGIMGALYTLGYAIKIGLSHKKRIRKAANQDTEDAGSTD